MAKTKQVTTTKLRIGAPIGFALSLASVYAFWQQALLLFILLVAISVFTLWVYDFRYIRTYLFVGVMGPIAEIIAIRSGAWQYTEPALINVSIWLFPLWGMAGLCFIAVAIYYQDVRMK